MKQILVITQIPSPYQVEFFNYLAAVLPDVDLVVGYVKRQDADRSWSEQHLAHDHLFLEDGADARKRLETICEEADFVIFGWYLDRTVRLLMARRERLGKPWAFWGERPGYRQAIAGRVMRRILLRPVNQSNAPIWGIGRWAVDAWRREFGPSRSYHNVPYFSNLERFLKSADVRGSRSHPRRILYSGALIERKGVDLLAGVFAEMAASDSSVELLILGDGPLRHEMKSSLSRCLDRVEFLGFRDWAELPRFYHSGDVLCAPSRRDGWGLIVPEGLAAGMPVIATDRMGSAIDLVEPGKNGWRVKANSRSELLAALQQATTMPEEQLAAMSRAAIESARNHTLKVGASRFMEASGFE